MGVSCGIAHLSIGFGLAIGMEKADAQGAVKDPERAIQVSVDLHPGAHMVMPVWTFGDLQDEPAIVNGVVILDDPFLLDAEDVFDVEPGCLHEGRLFAFGLDRNALIVGWNIDFPQISVGCIHVPNLLQCQFLDQPILMGFEGSFAASPGLRTVGRDMADIQLLQCAANLGQVGLVHLAARIPREEIVAAPIRVKRAKQAMPFNDFVQPPQA
jgi:hypothetical protein